MNKYNINGLTDKEVIKNREKYGTNKLVKESKTTFISLLIESLGDPIIKILLIALGIKIVFLFRDFNWFETLGILIAIFIASLKCKVKRNGKIKEVLIDEIVKDDIIVLESGDKVPADGIIIKGEVSVNESSINGESK